MLTLTRKAGESVVIDLPDGLIVVTVTRIGYGQVQLGFTACNGFVKIGSLNQAS